MKIQYITISVGNGLHVDIKIRHWDSLLNLTTILLSINFDKRIKMYAVAY